MCSIEGLIPFKNRKKAHQEQWKKKTKNRTQSSLQDGMKMNLLKTNYIKTERHVTTNKGIGWARFSDLLVLQRFMPFPCSVHLIGWAWGMSLRDDYASNKRMIKSTAGESYYDNAVNNNVWLMDGGWCAWKSVFEVCFRSWLPPFAFYYWFGWRSFVYYALWR